MKKLLLLALLFTHFFAYAQLDKQIGNLDENGLKTGEWKTYRMELLYSVGNYEAGKKTGMEILLSQRKAISNPLLRKRYTNRIQILRRKRQADKAV